MAVDHGDADVGHDAGGSPALSEVGRNLEVGEEVWRHYSPRKRGGGTDYYCKGCYKKLWF